MKFISFLIAAFFAALGLASVWAAVRGESGGYAGAALFLPLAYALLKMPGWSEQWTRKLESQQARKNLQKHGAPNPIREAAAQAAATYTLQYVLDKGTQPSRETVAGWLAKLETLPETQILGLHSDMA